MRVLKIGGNELDRSTFMAALAQALTRSPQPTALVHGGGAAVDDLQTRLGLTIEKVHGLRRTDADALEAATMALCGSVSKRLVAGLLTAGVDAVGLSGVDGGLLRARPIKLPEVDLGLVGEIVSVRVELVEALLERGITPVIAPISISPEGLILNVNADQAAGALASALAAEQLAFVSNVPGVRIDGAVVPRLEAGEARRLIASGAIRDGMVPKVQAAVAALERGVQQVRIADLAGMESAGGTTVMPDPVGPAPHEVIR